MLEIESFRGLEIWNGTGDVKWDESGLNYDQLNIGSHQTKIYCQRQIMTKNEMNF